jgi:parvulin-like peptidyl-prolyl isomerase
MLLLAVLAAAASAQFPGQPQQAEPLKFLPMDEVKRQIAAARGVPGPELPTEEERRREVAEVNGEKITLDALLDEVVGRFGEPLVPGLLNQAVMRMETIKRGTRLTEEEFAGQVQLFLAQKKTAQSKKTLREVLKESQFSWSTFERMISDQAKIFKIVRADLNMPKRQEPLNPFLVQIWAGRKLQGKYHMQQDSEKLPAGTLGEVFTLTPVSVLLARLVEGGFTVEVGEGAKNAEVVVAPAGGAWPRYRFPDVEIEEMTADGRIVKTPASAMMKGLLEAPAEVRLVEEYLRVKTEGLPPLELPPLEIGKQADAKSPETKAPLSELIEAVGKKGFGVQEDGTLRTEPEAWPAYTLPVAWIVGSHSGGLVSLVKKLQGKATTSETRVRVNRRFDLLDLPITMFSRVNRNYVLSFSYGKLESVHYQEGLKSLARFLAAKQTFKERGITVDEKAVKAIIDAENAQFNHPLFNRKMILQAKGKTVFDEDRRIWVGNGVDQIIGNEVDEATLRKYYQDNILHFANATVEAAHILAAVQDPDTGRVDFEKSRRKIDRIASELFAHPRPQAIFGELARRYSDDSMSAKKGGSLGPFTIRGQMAKSFAQAAFALNRGEISAPVKTAHGWHLILCQKRNPPDTARYPFEKKEIREQVRREYQQERRDQWLEEHVYRDMKLKKLSKIFATGE